MRKVSGLTNTKSQEKKGTFNVQAFGDSGEGNRDSGLIVISIPE